MAASGPRDWSKLHERSGECCFQCSKTLRDLNATGQAADRFYELVRYIETDRKLTDFRLVIRHHKQNSKLQVIIRFGDLNKIFKSSSDDMCMSCNPQHQLFEASRFSTQERTLAWLDAEGRSELIILTPRRHVERLSKLSVKDGEMAAFWQDAMNILDNAGETDTIRDMAINQGTYRTHAHLHLKIYFNQECWDKIADECKEQITTIRRIRNEQLVNKNEVDKFGDSSEYTDEQGHYDTVRHSFDKGEGLTKSSKFVHWVCMYRVKSQ